jgi:hypothetical protein
MTELESDFGKEVKQGAVVMALKRLTEELDFRLNHKINKVIKNIGEITVRSALIIPLLHQILYQTKSRLNYRY